MQQVFTGLTSYLTGKNTTKCKVLQTVAKAYDPIGFIAPFVIRIKFLLQELWQLANCVCQIQDQVSPSQWTYSKGTENPADSVSSGLATSNIYNKSLSIPWSSMVEEGNLLTSPV
ncbi:hypothetical protein CEXT_730171 [Caerostris extrusa]|uniref:Uncharacterized protein n=1 Tax=Caerostris extrusa TaxID=172846 RepID=A0AAV4XCS9_CAEEX|nr:hypothetical protein CEXT_730171 [Caerostris extrusa]